MSWPWATSSSSVGTENSGVPMKIRRRGIGSFYPRKHLALTRHGRAPPPHPRLWAPSTKQDVDARHKAGHDDGDWALLRPALGGLGKLLHDAVALELRQV